MKIMMKSVRIASMAVALSVTSITPARAADLSPQPGPIQHRFLACDFWKKTLWYVDQTSPGKNWQAPLPATPMELQLVGGNRVLISFNGSGYGILDLATHKLVEHHNPKGIAGSVSAWRLADGRTMVGVNRGKGVAIVEVDAAGAVAREWAFPSLYYLRMIRPTPQGTWLLAENDSVAEVTLADDAAADKRILRRFILPRPRNAYMGIRMANGNTVVGGGYSAGLFEYGTDGKLVRERVAPQPKGLSNYFYGGVQVLDNGHIVVANWTGHSKADYRPGWKIIEFDKDGNVVWHWFEHTPEAGTINNAIILDDLDTRKLNGK